MMCQLAQAGVKHIIAMYAKNYFNVTRQYIEYVLTIF